jgi:uncharacterized membrane protein
VEQFIGNLLRTGVLLAGAVVLVGGLAHTIGHAGEIPDYRTFRGEPADLRSITLIFRDAWSLQSTAVIELGLLLLIATPVARVFFAAVAFALSRDWLYTLVAFIVLSVLMASLAGYV